MNTIINSNQLASLQCVVLAGTSKYCDPHFKKYYDAAYNCWYDSLRGGLLSENQLAEAKNLTSDDFLRHDEIFCLLNQDEVVGLFPFSWFNLGFKANYQHSYFLRYPQDAIERLINEQHQLLMTIGTLSVVPEWRKAKVGCGVAEILVGLMIKRFLASPASLLLLYTRNDRKTNDLGYRHGGECWIKDCLVYNIASDVIGFYRDKVHLSTIPEIPPIVELIWEHKIDAVKLQRMELTSPSLRTPHFAG